MDIVMECTNDVCRMRRVGRKRRKVQKGEIAKMSFDVCALSATS